MCSLQWRHDGRDGVSNQQPYDYILNRLFRRWSKKTSKLRVTVRWIHRWPVNSPHKWQVTRMLFLFGDVIVCVGYIDIRYLHPAYTTCRVNPWEFDATEYSFVTISIGVVQTGDIKDRHWWTRCISQCACVSTKLEFTCIIYKTYDWVSWLLYENWR